jgi:ATP-binding cassette subfamily B (MDR/TAP) protein 1
MAFFANALMFWYGSTLIRTGEYNIIQFFVCLMAIIFGSQGAGQSFSFAPDMSQAKSATIDVTRLLEHEPDIDVWSEKGRRLDSPVNGHIDFKDVYFCYPSRPQEVVLRDLTFEVKSGQYVALVGPSGCGKSTIAALIERFYDPVSGQVSVDGVLISDYNLSDYRKSLAIVSQEPTLYQGTIRFNVVIGALKDEIS